jgi:hypothetical protein
VVTLATEVATAADGGALPALVKVVGGYDGTNVQVLAVNSSGEAQVEVLALPLPPGCSDRKQRYRLFKAIYPMF